MKRAEKLSFIEIYLLSRPDGTTRTEIAKALGVHRSTVSRCIDDLSFSAPLIEDDKNRLFINKTKYLNNIKLNIHEIFAIYLAVRLLSLTFRLYSPHLYSGIRKIAKAIEKFTPLFARFIKLTADDISLRSSELWKEKIRILEVLTEGWINNKKIGIKYKSKNSINIHKYTISVYFIEPYTAGKSIYIFAHADEVNEKRTFRLERIIKANLLKDNYTIENEFDYKSFFKDAWGIWNSGNKTEKVVLKFSPNAAKRLAETKWHDSQNIKINKDGSAIYSVNISETLEMVPWIRGWGSDVEVLEPKELRDFMRGEAKKLGEMYG